MNPWTAYLPTRKVLEEILRKYDNPQREPFTDEELHWMVNVLHALNDEPEYQKAQDELEAADFTEVVASPHGYQEPVNIALAGDEDENVS